MTKMDRDYPHSVGDYWALGPELIASTEEPGPTTVIAWKGAHFVRSFEDHS